MARSPLFGLVRRAMKMAAASEATGTPLDELFERAERREWSRREMLGTSNRRRLRKPQRPPHPPDLPHRAAHASPSSAAASRG